MFKRGGEEEKKKANKQSMKIEKVERKSTQTHMGRHGQRQRPLNKKCN